MVFVMDLNELCLAFAQLFARLHIGLGYDLLLLAYMIVYMTIKHCEIAGNVCLCVLESKFSVSVCVCVCS